MGRPERLMWFFQAMATMQSSGLSLVRSLESFDMGSDLVLRKASQTILAEVLNGRSLSTGMQLCVGVFSPYQVATIRLGESGPGVEAALVALAESEQRKIRLRQQFQRSLMMPVFLLVLVFLMGVLFLPFCIFPAYLQLLSGLQVPEVGWFGTLVAGMRLTQSPIFQIGCILALGLVGFVAFHSGQRESFCRSLLLVLAKIPGYGPYFSGLYGAASSWQSLMAGLEALFLSGSLGEVWGRAILYLRTAEFSSALSAQLEAGGKLTDALRPAAVASGSLLIFMHHPQMTEAIREGKKAYEAMAAPGIFPPMFLQMIETAEETGTLSEGCRKYGQFLAEEAALAIDTAVSLLEPLAVLFVGAVMAVLVLVMMYPLVMVVQAL